MAEAPLRRSLSRFAAQVDVEAMLQETLLRMWQVAPRIKPDGRANGLLRLAQVTARNLALSELRRRRVMAEQTMTDQDLPEAIAVAAPDPFLRTTIAHCREQLPDQPAGALTARLESPGAHSDHQLAEQLGMRLNTFLQNFTRARRLLAECLQRAGIELDLEMS